MPGDFLHFAGYKIRVTGTGVLKSTIKGLDFTVTETFANITMSQNPGITYTRLSNMQSHKALIRFETTEIDETFEISNLIVFVKPLWSELPN